MGNLKKLTIQQKIGLLLLLLLLVVLPVAILLTGQKQEIRPRAEITGQANFHLSTTASSPKSGDSFNVVASLELTDPGLRVSGVDFRILYDKSKLEPAPTVEPATGSGKPFTDVILSQVDQPWSETLNYLRVVMVARKLTPELSCGSNIPLATITFKAKANGAAAIRYPKKDKDANQVDFMQVSGVEAGNCTAEPSLTPTSVP